MTMYNAYIDSVQQTLKEKETLIFSVIVLIKSETTIITSNPTLVENVNVHLGISDHHILTFNISFSPKHQPKSPRKIHLFNKADLQQLKKAADDLSTDFLQSDPKKRDVETNWMMISKFLNRCLSELIPSKMSKGKRHLPWITPAI